MHEMIRATVMYLFMGLFIALFAPFALLWVLITGNPHLLFVLGRFCIRATGWVGGVRVLYEGREKILPGKTYVFLSNHLANFDGPVLCHVIPRDCRALIKQEIMQVPLLSLVLKKAQFVPLERLNPKKAQMGIEQGASLLREGKSFFVFPEGTRSRDGRLGDFKKGAFIMAIKAQTPVIPVTILGSNQIQRPGRYGIRPGTIRVIFHEPIATEGMVLEDRNRLIQLTKSAIASKLPE
jgi:1-acyl-sn-glycerol-3-phosphate acyltransferase